MKSTTLIETKDAGLVKRAFELGHKITANIPNVLTEEELVHFEQHLDEIPAGLLRFADRNESPQEGGQAFQTSSTDLPLFLKKAEEHAEKCFGIRVNLSEIFQIPETVPWKEVLPVFIPAGTDNRKAVDALEKAGFNKPWEEVDVMEYTGSSASDTHQLFLIERSETPTKDTMGKSPDALKAQGRLFLNLKGYAIAMGLFHSETKGYLDPETFTWFPNDRLPGDRVAVGCWCPSDRGVRFGWCYSGGEGGYGGARLAIPVPLKPFIPRG